MEYFHTHHSLADRDGHSSSPGTNCVRSIRDDIQAELNRDIAKHPHFAERHLPEVDYISTLDRVHLSPKQNVTLSYDHHAVVSNPKNDIQGLGLDSNVVDQSSYPTFAVGPIVRDELAISGQPNS